MITAIVAVGANAVAAGGDHPAALILGAGILVVAVFTPYVLLSIIPLGTLAVAEGLSRRPLHAGSSGMSSLYWGQALLGGGGGAGGGAGAIPLPPAPGGPAGSGAIPPPLGGPATAPLAVVGGAAQAAKGAAQGAAQAMSDVAQTAPMPPAAPKPPGVADGR